MPRRRNRATVSLPRGVHRVVSRGREYYYFQRGRGTVHAGERIALPNDPHMPDFWHAVRHAQGMVAVAVGETFDALVDGYLLHIRSAGEIKHSTIYQYERALAIGRNAWGALPARGLRPVHVQAVMDGLAATPGKANNFLTAMRAISAWASVRDHIDRGVTEGIKPYAQHGGHKPWSPEQVKAATEQLTGMVRRGVLLYLYTGMRGSDAVRLGWTDIDDGGFCYRSVKTGRDVYCPIVPQLAAEMATWERRPGPFLYHTEGRGAGQVYTRKIFSRYFAAARDAIPELAGTTLHGLRCTAVVRLRQAGLSTAQIGDIVGMSIPMIERYCRFADRKANGKAAYAQLLRNTT